MIPLKDPGSPLLLLNGVGPADRLNADH